MAIKNYLIKALIKFKVEYSLPGRLKLKVTNASKIPETARLYDQYVIQGIKILDGVDNVDFNYSTGHVLVKYDTDKLCEDKIVKWINKIIEVGLDNKEFIQENGEDNLDYVVDTLEKKLQDEVKNYK